MFTTENTTHEDAVRLLNDREAKNTDLYNSLGATQRESHAKSEQIKEMRTALCFFKSVIQSGEPWSAACQNTFDNIK